MNCQPRKIETLHNQITHNQTTQNKHYHKKKKVNQQNLKRITNIEKTTLPSLRNIELRTVKTERNKINQVLPYKSMDNVTKLNEIFSAEAKVICEKVGILSKSTKKKSKPGWEIRLETQIKNL